MGEFLSTWLSSWRGVLLRPKSFFEDMDVNGGLGEPIGFFSVLLAVNSTVGLGRMLIMQGVQASNVIQLVLSIVIVGVAGAAVCLLVQLLARLMDGQGELEGTVRALAFSSALNLVFWIPFWGMLPFVHMLVLSTLGLAAVHRIGFAKAAVLALPFPVFFAGVNLFLWAAFRVGAGANG